MIIITTYYNRYNDKRFQDREKYLLETIRSIDKQPIKNIFHLIVDDGSNPDIRSFIDKSFLNPDKRTIIRREKKKNELLTSTNARNFGLNYILHSKRSRFSGHEYITFIDSDDLLVNLEDRCDYIVNNKPSFLYSNALLFFDTSEKGLLWEGLPPETDPANFWIKGRLPYPTMTWEISFLSKLYYYVKSKYGVEGPFDPNIGCGEDVDIALSSLEFARAQKKKISFLPEITAAYRIHTHSLATIRDPKKRKEEEDSVLTKHFGKDQLGLLHAQRLLLRPECYFGSLYPLRNLFEKKLNKSKILGEI